jgi:hypothetical protein
MASGLKFGIQQRIIDGHLEPASIGRNECDALNLRFEFV